MILAKKIIFQPLQLVEKQNVARAMGLDAMSFSVSEVFESRVIRETSLGDSLQKITIQYPLRVPVMPLGWKSIWAELLPYPFTILEWLVKPPPGVQVTASSLEITQRAQDLDGQMKFLEKQTHSEPLLLVHFAGFGTEFAVLSQSANGKRVAFGVHPRLLPLVNLTQGDTEHLGAELGAPVRYLRAYQFCHLPFISREKLASPSASRNGPGLISCSEKPLLGNNRPNF